MGFDSKKRDWEKKRVKEKNLTELTENKLDRKLPKS